MTNIIKFPGLTNLDIDAAEILQEIAKDKPKDVFVICWPEDDSLPTYHSTTGDMPIILMRIQEFIHKFYSGDFND